MNGGTRDQRSALELHYLVSDKSFGKLFLSDPIRVLQTAEISCEEETEYHEAC